MAKVKSPAISDVPTLFLSDAQCEALSNFVYAAARSSVLDVQPFTGMELKRIAAQNCMDAHSAFLKALRGTT